MIYAFFCEDGGDKKELRERYSMAHLRYIESVYDRVVLAGATLPAEAEDETEFCGALFLYEADNPEDARTIMDDDPFYQNGIWHSVKMVAFPPFGRRLLGERPWKLSENSMKEVSLKYDSSVARWKPE